MVINNYYLSYLFCKKYIYGGVIDNIKKKNFFFIKKEFLFELNYILKKSFFFKYILLIDLSAIDYLKFKVKFFISFKFCFHKLILFI